MQDARGIRNDCFTYGVYSNRSDCSDLSEFLHFYMQMKPGGRSYEKKMLWKSVCQYAAGGVHDDWFHRLREETG